MVMSAEYRYKICSNSPVKVTSPYEWKFLEWDENPQTNIYICIYHGIYIYWSVTESTSSNCHTFFLSVELQQLSMSEILHPGSVNAHYRFLWTSMPSTFPYALEKKIIYLNTAYSSFIAAMIGCPCIPISRCPVHGLWPYNCYPDCGSCCTVVREFVVINILI